MADKWHWVPVLLAVTKTLLSSCALIKENRDPCPCRLEIHLTGTQGSTSRVRVFTGDDSWDYSVAGDTVISAFVPRGRVSVTAWSGAPEPSNGEFVIPDGTSAPPLYLCHCTVNTDADEAIARAQLRKQFCTLSIGVDGPPGWERPFGTMVRGSVTGMNIHGLPLEGPFRCISGESQDSWNLRIPRQNPDSPLYLDIVMADSIVRSFSIGSCLVEAGFDWSAPDLGDIDLQLRLSVTSLTIHSPSWEPPVSISIDI